LTEAPAWARGYPLDFLREISELYREEFKPHTYGAFGIPKERDVADAMEENALMWARAPGGNRRIEAAAVARLVRRPQPHDDFAGRHATMRPGDIFVRSMAGSWEGKCRLLDNLAHRKAPAMWVEAHVENSEMARFLTAAGFERVLTKVSASSDLKGLYLLGGNDESRRPGPLDAADLPGVKVLDPDFLHDDWAAAVLAEIDAYGRGAFAQHYSGYNKRQTWTAFALRGFDPADPAFIIKPAEMSRKWKDENPSRLAAECDWTPAFDHFHVVKEILKRLPVGGLQRVRFMRLSAGGGELTRHADITDPEAGTADGKIARLHIPIATNLECVFRSWTLDGEEHRLHMPERGLSYIDTRKPHAVINPADIERIHLVVDAVSTPELRRMIAA
jgi:hypothetical protein